MDNYFKEVGRFAPCLGLPWKENWDIRPDLLVDYKVLIDEVSSRIAHHHEDEDYEELGRLRAVSESSHPVITFTKMYDAGIGLIEYLQQAHNLWRALTQGGDVNDAMIQDLLDLAPDAFPGKWRATRPGRTDTPHLWPEDHLAGILFGPEGSGYGGTGHLGWIYTPPGWEHGDKLMRDYFVFLEPGHFIKYMGFQKALDAG
jgi:hypothetical protein